MVTTISSQTAAGNRLTSRRLMDTPPPSNRDSQTIHCGGRQATHRGHKMPPISQTRRKPVENVVGTDSGQRVSKPTAVILLDMRQGGCQERRLLPTIGKCPAMSAAERRAGIAQCNLSKLTGKLIEEEQQLSAAVMIGGNSYKAAIDTGATASFVSEEMADNIAALGRITRTRRQVRLAQTRRTTHNSSTSGQSWNQHTTTDPHQASR